jgi:hypothetical protein
MSELKAYNHELRHNEYEKFYLKYEADKVIAEKDKEIARLDDLSHAHNIELLRKENLIEELKQEIERLKKENEMTFVGLNLR